MKRLLVIALVLAGLTSTAQKQTYIKIPESKDSIYYRIETDTLKGTVTYKVGNGSVAGDAILVKYEHWKCTERKEKYREKPKVSADGTIWGIQSGSCYQQSKYSTCYLKTNSGYKRVDEPFTFKPF